MDALQYEGGEPCSICGHVMIPAAARDHDSCMPTTILSGFLYLGSYDTASRQELLKALGITHVLNTVPTCPALYKNTFTYHTVELAPPEFDECFTFLDGVQREQKRVLVYCMSGITRYAAAAWPSAKRQCQLQREEQHHRHGSPGLGPASSGSASC
eukprot:GHRQ01038556.1.p1 GENE.GHRQ01038556.1~~GHRQ01038556.1.p1  ORF type:complete len:156 (+),score=34.49 GHRQ01038556.1:333-800(+)